MDLIYHYCDANPLISFVRDGTIWLSSLRAMNDTGELNYVRDIAIPIIHQGLKNYGRQDEGLLFAAYMDRTQYYAACFSKLPDDLYQWQVYGQKGRGFSVGFDPEILCPDKPNLLGVGGGTFQAPMATPGQYTLGISAVQYHSKAQIEKLAQDIADLLQARQNIAPVSIAMIASMVNVLSSVIKSEAFSAESEQRLLYAPTIQYPQGDQTHATVMGPIKDRKWRNGTYGLTPYFEYGHINRRPDADVDVIIEPNCSVKNAMREIILGPCCLEQPEGLLRDFLNSHGLGGVKITRSKATLR